jgi:hypothetical protein
LNDGHDRSHSIDEIHDRFLIGEYLFNLIRRQNEGSPRLEDDGAHGTRAISQISNFLCLPRDGGPLLFNDAVAVVLANYVQSPAGRGIHGSYDELGLAVAATAALAALRKLCLELGILALQISLGYARHG